MGDGDKPTAYGSIPLPALGADDILVKVASAVVNPSDVFFTKKFYPAGKPLPTTCGFEGAGVVTHAGDGAKDLIGKKVSFMAKGGLGSWGDYTILDKWGALPLPDDADLEKAAGMFVNPWTVYGF